MTKIMDAVMEHAGRAMLGMGQPDAVAATVATWNACVATLMSPEVTPAPRLNDAASLLWSLCSSRTICTAMMPDVPSLSFIGLVTRDDSGREIGIIAIPENWLRLFAVDPWLQLGAVMYSASRARDFWSGKLREIDIVTERRAKAHEAEFLRFALADESKKRFKATAYQGAVLAAFPSFPTDLEYESVPFDLARAQAKFGDYSDRGIQLPVGPAETRK